MFTAIETLKESEDRSRLACERECRFQRVTGRQFDIIGTRAASSVPDGQLPSDLLSYCPLCWPNDLSLTVPLHRSLLSALQNVQLTLHNVHSSRATNRSTRTACLRQRLVCAAVETKP